MVRFKLLLIAAIATVFMMANPPAFVQKIAVKHSERMDIVEYYTQTELPMVSSRCAFQAVEEKTASNEVPVAPIEVSMQCVDDPR